MKSKHASLGAVAGLVIVMVAVLVLQRPAGETYAFHGGTWDPPRSAPELAMTDQYGNDFLLEHHRGKVVIVFFGYTFCPDFCPSTMVTVVEVMNMLGEDADNVEVAFVSVDPARDTPERLAEYMGFFSPGFFGLSATEAETDAIKMAWGVRGDAHEPEEGKPYYLVDHTTTLFAVAPDGTLAVEWAYGTDAELITEDIQQLLRT